MAGDEGYKQNAVVAEQPGFGRTLPMERIHSQILKNKKTPCGVFSIL